MKRNGWRTSTRAAAFRVLVLLVVVATCFHFLERFDVHRTCTSSVAVKQANESKQASAPQANNGAVNMLQLARKVQQRLFYVQVRFTS
jgi:hypothetical protein